MPEQEPRSRIVYENPPSTLLLRRAIPHRLSIQVGDMVFGQGLTPRGHEKLREGLRKILRQEHITPGRDIYPAYEDAIEYKVEGEENIPRSGTTLFIGNHIKSPLLCGMVHFIEAARVVHDVRQDVADNMTREPRIILQRGIRKPLKLRGRKIVTITVPFSEPFYHLAAESLNWITVKQPKFDQNGQITNRQSLPQGLTGEFLGGQALFLFPQGKNDKPGEIIMPEKPNGFMTGLKDYDIKVNGVVFEGNHITFGKSVHIQDFPRNNAGELDVNLFARQFMTPLLAVSHPFQIDNSPSKSHN